MSSSHVAQDRVKAVCRDIYGEDGTPTQIVDVQVSIPAGDDRDKHLYRAGRLIARSFDRDSGAKMGGGVILLSGDISSGGSRKSYPVMERYHH
jgi:hypothetical protein